MGRINIVAGGKGQIHGSFNINLILHVLNLSVKAANISLESAKVLATSQLISYWAAHLKGYRKVN